jgi:hypothetical protein
MSLTATTLLRVPPMSLILAPSAAAAAAAATLRWVSVQLRTNNTHNSQWRLNHKAEGGGPFD